MATDVELCSRALLLLGDNPISSLEEDESDAATLCAAVYPSLRKSYLSKYPWRFAMKRVALTRVAGVVEGGGWSYQFTLPSDRASGGAFAAFPSDSDWGSPFAEWDIRGKRLVANVDRVWVEYAYTVGEADFPEYFADFLVAALCSRIAFAVTDQQNAATHWKREAFGGDDEAGGLYLSAQIADSQQHPSPQIRGDYDLIIARFGP